ncbi:MAG: hypothetical protein ABIH82_03925, partial [Candidatus Woesearchaeota archaeon]
LYQHLIRFYKWNKETWTILAKDYLQNDEYTTMIIQGVTEKDFCEKTGLSRPTYYRIKQKVSKSHDFLITR